MNTYGQGRMNGMKMLGLDRMNERKTVGGLDPVDGMRTVCWMNQIVRNNSWMTLNGFYQVYRGCLGIPEKSVAP